MSYGHCELACGKQCGSCSFFRPYSPSQSHRTNNWKKKTHCLYFNKVVHVLKWVLQYVDARSLKNYIAFNYVSGILTYFCLNWHMDKVMVEQRVKALGLSSIFSIITCKQKGTCNLFIFKTKRCFGQVQLNLLYN